jgi:PufQ cytochrome subunit
MTDHSTNGVETHTEHHPVRTPHAEFYVYFSLIFLLATPVAILGWIASTVTQGHMPDQNAISRAWSDAMAITPLIFRA